MWSEGANPLIYVGPLRFCRTRSQCEAKGTGKFCVLWSTAGYVYVFSFPLPCLLRLPRSGWVLTRLGFLWWGGNGISGLVSLVPHLVSCVALFIIAVGLGERQVRKSRRRKGWKGIAGCSLTSGSSFPLFYSLPPCLSLLLSLEELKRPPLSLSRFLAGNRLAAGRHASLGRARLPNGWKSV